MIQLLEQKGQIHFILNSSSLWAMNRTGIFTQGLLLESVLSKTLIFAQGTWIMLEGSLEK